MATEANLEFEDDTLQNETDQNDLEQPLLSGEERSEDDQKMNTRKFTRKGSDSRPEASGGTRALETKAWNPRPEANGTKRPLERQAWNPRPEASRTQSVPKAGSRNT